MSAAFARRRSRALAQRGTLRWLSVSGARPSHGLPHGNFRRIEPAERRPPAAGAQARAEQPTRIFPHGSFRTAHSGGAELGRTARAGGLAELVRCRINAAIGRPLCFAAVGSCTMPLTRACARIMRSGAALHSARVVTGRAALRTSAAVRGALARRMTSSASRGGLPYVIALWADEPRELNDLGRGAVEDVLRTFATLGRVAVADVLGTSATRSKVLQLVADFSRAVHSRTGLGVGCSSESTGRQPMSAGHCGDALEAI